MERKKVSDYRPSDWERWKKDGIEIILKEMRDGDKERILEALEQSFETVFRGGIMSILQAMAESKMEWEWGVGDNFNGCLKLIFSEIPYAFTFDFGNVMAFEEILFQGADALGFVKARKEAMKKRKDDEIAQLDQLISIEGAEGGKDWQEKLKKIAEASKKQTEKDREENETDKGS